jgi:hypothetical protein
MNTIIYKNWNLENMANNVISVDFASNNVEPVEPVQLVDNVDAAFALWACNMFGIQHSNPDDLEHIILSIDDLYTMQPSFVRECLQASLHSTFLTDSGKKIIARMLANTK